MTLSATRPARWRGVAVLSTLAMSAGIITVTAAPAAAVTVSNTSSLNQAIVDHERLIELSQDIRLDSPIALIDYTSASSPLVIDGKGHTIDLNGVGWELIMSSVTIRNLTLVDRRAPVDAVALTLVLDNGDVVIIDGVTMDGIDYGVKATMDEGAQLTIKNSEFRNGKTAIDAARNGKNGMALSVENVKISSMTIGMLLQAGKDDTVRVRGAEIRDSGNAAIVSYISGGSLLIDGVLARGGKSGVIAAVVDGGDGTIQNVSASGFDSFGLEVSSVNSVVNLSGVDLYGNAERGLDATSSGTGRLTVRDSTVRDTLYGVGAVLTGMNTSQLRVIGSTFSGNPNVGIDVRLSLDAQVLISNTTVTGTIAAASRRGTGGIAVERLRGSNQAHPIGSASVRIEHTTVTNNTVYAGISASEVPVTVTHSLVGGNTASGGDLVVLSGPDNNGTLLAEWSAYGTAYSERSPSGFVDGVGVKSGLLDPGLGPLADNGGPTLTHAPLPGSVAIDAGNPGVSGAPALDQRRGDRVVGSTIDIGAVESRPGDGRTGHGPGAGGGGSQDGADDGPGLSTPLPGAEADPGSGSSADSDASAASGALDLTVPLIVLAALVVVGGVLTFFWYRRRATDIPLDSAE